MRFRINGKAVEAEKSDLDTPLLWFLREQMGLTGTKYSCGVGACGACTVHINGTAMRSCSVPIAALDGAEVTTIEGVASGGPEMHPVLKAWIELDVPQCGYCQPGQIMSAVALLQNNPNPSAAEVKAGMTNLCRCGIYNRIHAAVLRAAEIEKNRAEQEG